MTVCALGIGHAAGTPYARRVRPHGLPAAADEWFARLTGGTQQRLIDEPSQDVPDDLLSEVTRDLRPATSTAGPGWAVVVPDRKKKRRGRGQLLWDYMRYVKLTALYVQYVRAMERRDASPREIRPPQHPVAAGTIAELHAVDRDPSETWGEYQQWLAMSPPGR